jgi:hypothetical protein
VEHQQFSEEMDFCALLCDESEDVAVKETNKSWTHQDIRYWRDFDISNSESMLVFKDRHVWKTAAGAHLRKYRQFASPSFKGASVRTGV